MEVAADGGVIAQRGTGKTVRQRQPQQEQTAIERWFATESARKAGEEPEAVGRAKRSSGSYPNAGGTACSGHYPSSQLLRRMPTELAGSRRGNQRMSSGP